MKFFMWDISYNVKSNEEKKHTTTLDFRKLQVSKGSK